MQASSQTSPPRAGVQPAETLRAAFRELHGPRLHGFALLITLGDRVLAARIASDALTAGTNRVNELSHPERAAAWLRRRVVREARRAHESDGAAGGRRRAALEDLGVNATAFAALAGLDILERAALVASTVEGLDAGDVATIVGQDGARLDRLIRRSRSRAMLTSAPLGGDADDDGPIATRVRAIAARALT